MKTPFFPLPCLSCSSLIAVLSSFSFQSHWCIFRAELLSVEFLCSDAQTNFLCLSCLVPAGSKGQQLQRGDGDCFVTREEQDSPSFQSDSAWLSFISLRFSH